MVKEKNNKNGIIKKYALFVTKNPFVVIVLAILITIFAIHYSGMIKNESVDYKNILPESIEVIKANNIFEDNFGTTDTVSVVLELDSQVIGSTEPKEISDYRIIEYMDTFEEYVSSSSEIKSTESAANILRLIHQGKLPKDNKEINNDIEKNGILSQYISQDKTLAVIKIQLVEDYDQEEVVDELLSAIDELEAPQGVKVSLSGEAASQIIVNRMIAPDMAKTSQISMFGIIIILVLSFWSIKYGLMPLTTIIIGVIWTMGFIGLMGIGMNSATSGVISMIMGIGIDFGIQVINRFRQEYNKLKQIEESMRITLEAVVFPMLITTLAAIIGFKAMSMGQLQILADMGNMMMYGVVFCFLVAITIIPVLVIYVEKTHLKIKNAHKKLIKKRR